MRSTVVAVALALAVAVAPRAQDQAADLDHRTTFDQILDTYVRDGFVYYRALRIDRGKLDAYIKQLSTVEAAKLSKNEQIAFWLNAYNALVLQTVVDHYPITARTSEYPQHSIRQIPGAFERLPHTVGGRTLTLDQIEQSVLPAFGDARVFFALGRGSVGGGRLRSEAFQASAIDVELASVAEECLSRAECVNVEAGAERVSASAIFSWREKEFVAAYANRTANRYPDRSPIERAILAFVEPKLLESERTYLSKNTFRVAYQPFDWSLNDLTGRGGR